MNSKVSRFAADGVFPPPAAGQVLLSGPDMGSEAGSCSTREACALCGSTSYREALFRHGVTLCAFCVRRYSEKKRPAQGELYGGKRP